MAIAIGSTGISNMYIGGTQISKAYMGDVQVYPSGGPIPSNTEIWYTTTDGNLIVPYKTTGWGANIVSNSYEDGKGIITFDGDVTTVPYMALYAYGITTNTLDTIILPSSVSSIGDIAFGYQNNMTSVMFHSDNISISGYCIFQNCESLSSLDASVFNTENVTSFFGLFYGCHSLETIDVSHFNTSNATSFSNMFNGCKSITSMNLSNFDTSNATNLSQMFGTCPSLESIDLSSFDLSKVSDMSFMFDFDSALSRIKVGPHFFRKDNNVDISNMYYGLPSTGTFYYPASSGYDSALVPTGWTVVAY